MKGIAEMFAELDGRDRYHETLEIVGAAKRADAVGRTRLWRILNPAKFRAQRNSAKNKAATSAWRKRNRARMNQQRKAYEAKDRERTRAAWRRRQNAYRARKRAA